MFNANLKYSYAHFTPKFDEKSGLDGVFIRFNGDSSLWLSLLFGPPCIALDLIKCDV